MGMLRVIYLSITMVLFLLGLCGNILVLTVGLSSRSRTYRSYFSFLILNLCVADTISLCVIVFETWRLIFSTGKVITSDHVICRWYIYIMYLSMLASVNFLVALSFERVKNHQKNIFKNVVFNQRRKMIVACIWGSSSLFYLPMLLLYNVDTLVLSKRNYTICYDEWPNGTLRASYYIGSFVITFLLPLTLMAFNYSRVLILIRRVISSAGRGHSANPLMSSARRISTIIIILMIAFVICWMPLNLVNLASVIVGSSIDTRTFLTAYLITTVFACCNSCVNPTIYIFLSAKFRREARRTITSCRDSISFRYRSYRYDLINLLK